MCDKTICKSMFLLLVISIFISLGLMGCGSSQQSTQARINQTKESDVFPTKSPPEIEGQPSQTLISLTEVALETSTPEFNVLDSLRKELAYGGGGGGGGDQGLQCEEPASPPYSELPAIQGACRFRFCLSDEEYTCDEDIYNLYIFGFPFDQAVQLELYDPSGKLAGIDEIIVEGFDTEYNSGWLKSLSPNESYVSRGRATSVEEVEVLIVDLWMPAWQPTGVWNAIVRSENLSAKGSFTVQTQNRLPNIYVIPEFIPNPFDNYQIYNFTAGQQFSILGTGFQSEGTYALGIYYITVKDGNSAAELDLGIPVTADEDGVFSSSIEIVGSDPAGSYIAYVDLDPSYDHVSLAGTWTAFNVPNWQPCSDGLLSYLGPKNSAFVNNNSSVPAPLMAEPFTDAEIFGQLQPGEYVEILDGPECQEGMVWWLVESEDSSQLGWIPEEDAEQYWLISP